jgi:isopenicillin N synthase-like dioxygenase
VSVPSIDLRSATPEEVGRACEEIGFLTVVGHGVPDEVVERVAAAARAFFALGGEEKRRLGASGELSDGLPVYRPLESERLAATLGGEAPADLKESLDWGPAVPGVAWPERPPELRDALLDYHAAVSELAARLRRLLARALALDEDWFEPAFAQHASSMRVIHYPGGAGAPRLGAGAHTDYGFLTILRSPDDPGGLQVQTPSGGWLDVAASRDGFVVNLGDMAQRWTNDRWRATLHRVRPVERERYSLVFFHDPAPETLIEPIVAPGEEPRYEPITAFEHIRAKAVQALS